MTERFSINHNIIPQYVFINGMNNNMKHPNIVRHTLSNGHIRFNENYMDHRHQWTVDPHLVNVQEFERELWRKLRYRIMKHIVPGTVLLSDFSEQWFSEYVLTHLSRSSQINYRSILKNIIIPVLGHIKLQDLTRKEIHDMLTELLINKKQSMAQVIRVKSIIHNIMEYGIFSGIIQDNPATHLTYTFKSSGMKKNPCEKTWTISHIDTLLSLAKQLDTDFHEFLLTLLGTGCRPMEAVGIKRSDCNFQYDYIMIQRSIFLGKESTTKNKRVRKIFIPRNLSLLLQSRISSPSGYLFSKSKDKPFSQKFIYTRMQEIIIAGQLPNFGLKGLRSYYASLLDRSHIDKEFIQSQLGHAQRQTTDIYLRSIEEETRCPYNLDTIFPHNITAIPLFSNPGKKVVYQ